MKRLMALAATAAVALAISACGTTEDPAAEDEKSSTGGPVTVVDARGKEVTLDGPATRVGGTEWNVVEYLMALGVEPTAASDVEGFTTWNSSFELSDDVTDIGTRGEPDTDLLFELGLDVLFVTDSLVDGAIEQIEERVPVIVVPGGDSADPIGQMWKNVDLVAKVTGTEDEAAKLKTDFDARLAETADAVEAAGLTDTPLAFSDAYNTGEAVVVRAYTSGSLVGDVLGRVGFANAWDTIDGIEGDPAYGLGQADVETLTKLPDATLYWYIEEIGQPGVYEDDLTENPIWTGLPFVENGDVHRLPDRMWMFGGPTSMSQFLDAVDAAIA